MKIMLISFFYSNNIGDLALSKALERLVLSNNSEEVIKYDFLTSMRVLENKRQSDFNETTLNNSVFVSCCRDQIKTALFKLFGERNMSILVYKFRKLLLKNNKQLALNMKNVDKVIIGGGNMLMDLSPVWPYILKDITNLAIRNQIPYEILFVGAGPIKHKKSKLIYRDILSNANKVSVRGDKSKRVLEDINSSIEIVQTIDPVFSLDIDFYSRRIKKINDRELSKSKLIVGVCVISEVCLTNQKEFESYLIFIKNMLLNYASKYEFVLFSTESLDYSVIDRLNKDMKKMSLTSIRIEYLKDEEEVIALYETLDFLIGGRMHALIFAQKCLLPYLGVIWQEKIEEFSEITSSQEYIFNIKEFSNLNIEKMLQKSINTIERVDKMNEINEYLKKAVVERFRKSDAL